MNDMTQAKYILGHSQQEIGRLILQATILRPFTERLMRNAEIGPGMRVLDVGCGAGDVSMLAAELVGPSGSPQHDSANRLIEHFSNAGLPAPSLFREMLVGGGTSSPLYAWLADTMRSVWPQLVEMGIATEVAIPAESLATRVRSAVVEARSQIEAPAQVCVWTRI
jgi:hypothetical protein